MASSSFLSSSVFSSSSRKTATSIGVINDIEALCLRTDGGFETLIAIFNSLDLLGANAYSCGGDSFGSKFSYLSGSFRVALPGLDFLGNTCTHGESTSS